MVSERIQIFGIYLYSTHPCTVYAVPAHPVLQLSSIIFFAVYRRNLNYEDVLEALAKKGISIRVASPKLVMEEVQVFLFLI